MGTYEVSWVEFRIEGLTLREGPQIEHKMHQHRSRVRDSKVLVQKSGLMVG